MVTTTMQERAAKVADARLAKLKDAESKCEMNLHVAMNLAQQAEAEIIGDQIRALPPDPTRAALEECVRAMEPLIKLAEQDMKLNRDEGDGGYWSLSIVDAIADAKSAVATARALQGE